MIRTKTANLLRRIKNEKHFNTQDAERVRKRGLVHFSMYSKRFYLSDSGQMALFWFEFERLKRKLRKSQVKENQTPLSSRRGH